MTRDEAARYAARLVYCADDGTDVDTDARVSHLDEQGPDTGAAWVQAWVLVSAEDIDKQLSAEGAPR